MTLNLIRRLVKGTPLTAAEHDGNLDKLEDAIEAREALGAVAAHVAAADPHPGYLTQAEGDGRYRQSATALSDSDIPAGIARDSEVAAAIGAHEAAVDPHPGYLTAAEGDAAYVGASDARLADAREWIASTISEAEAAAGTATTRRAWTAQRVRQAIAAWWTGASTAAGRAMVEALDAAAQRTLLGLGTADSPSFTGLTITGTAPVIIPHIHGSIAGNFYVHVRNTSGGPLAAGTAVYATGSVGDTDRITVAACDPTDPLKMPAIGVLETTLANNGDGDAVVLGELRPINTAAYTLGAELYVGAAGALVATLPASGIVQRIGVVARVQSNTGTIVVGIGPEMARVGFTGAYGDLSGTPTIPAPADAAPAALAATAAIGTSTDYAREDHAHQRDSDVLVIPVGDETTALTTGTAKVSFRMPFAATLLAVRAGVNTAPTGSTLIVDINEAGTTLLSTKLSIDASETTSTTAAVPAVISDSNLADEAIISIDIDQIGSTIAGAGLKVSLFVRRS